MEHFATSNVLALARSLNSAVGKLYESPNGRDSSSGDANRGEKEKTREKKVIQMGLF